MGKRYYCDYCDKSFPDSIINRKNHNKGYKHVQNKNIYFCQFNNPKSNVRNLEFPLNNPQYSQQLNHHIAKFEQKLIKKNRDNLIDKLPHELIQKTHGWCPLYYQNSLPEVLKHANLSLLPSLNYTSFDKTSENLLDKDLLDCWGLDK